MSFYQTKILASSAETPLCQLITLQPPAALVPSFTTPGQYTVIRLKSHQDNMFALANRSGSAPWEYLIKKNSPQAEQLARLKPGSPVEITAAQGRGYDVTRARRKDVYLLCVGSGIAPIRSLLNYFLDHPETSRSLHLYYGVHEPKEFAFAREFTDWERTGVSITHVIHPAHPEWQGLVGYVENFLPKKMVGEKTVAYLCGMKSMMDETRAILLERGVGAEDILQN